jgi:hypothetical protein
MAIIPSTFKLDWYDPSQPGGVTSALNDNANTATSNATQYTMEDIINTVSYTGGSIDGSGAQYALPVFTDTNTITNLPLGAAGELLTSGGPGVDPAWGAAPSTGPYAIGAGANSAKLVGDGTNIADQEFTVVSGGQDNKAQACFSGVVGGEKNEIFYGFDPGPGEYGCGNFIGGGKNNTIGTDGVPAEAVAYSSILGGSSNSIQGSEGDKNSISTIVGGEQNSAHFHAYGFIGGGGGNRICDELWGPGGSKSGFSSILTGAQNQICVPAAAAGTKGMYGPTIVAGGDNQILDQVGGQGMEFPMIVGGQKNAICGVQQDGTIVGGVTNLIENPNNDSGGAFGFIGGGESNTISNASNAFIGAGRVNTICNVSNCSSILGGSTNTVSSSGNTHVIGSNIAATLPDRTYVNNLNVGQAVPLADYADNVAALAGGLVAGDVYRLTGADTLNIVH